MVMMTTKSVTETKRGLSALLDRVKAGETITITDRGVPVAQLVPLNGGAEADWDAHMQRLAREGVVRLPRKKLDVEAFLAMPKARSSKSVLEALLEERRESTR
jgi:prevent-host-death family protein